MLLVTFSSLTLTGNMKVYFLWSKLGLNGGSKKLFKMTATGLFKLDVSNLSLNLLEYL